MPPAPIARARPAAAPGAIPAKQRARRRAWFFTVQGTGGRRVASIVITARAAASDGGGEGGTARASSTLGRWLKRNNDKEQQQPVPADDDEFETVFVTEEVEVGPVGAVAAAEKEQHQQPAEASAVATGATATAATTTTTTTAPPPQPSTVAAAAPPPVYHHNNTPPQHPLTASLAGYAVAAALIAAVVDARRRAETLRAAGGGGAGATTGGLLLSSSPSSSSSSYHRDDPPAAYDSPLHPPELRAARRSYAEREAAQRDADAALALERRREAEAEAARLKRIRDAEEEARARREADLAKQRRVAARRDFERRASALPEELERRTQLEVERRRKEEAERKAREQAKRERREQERREAELRAAEAERLRVEAERLALQQRLEERARLIEASVALKTIACVGRAVAGPPLPGGGGAATVEATLQGEVVALPARVLLEVEAALFDEDDEEKANASADQLARCSRPHIGPEAAAEDGPGLAGEAVWLAARRFLEQQDQDGFSSSTSTPLSPLEATHRLRLAAAVAHAAAARATLSAASSASAAPRHEHAARFRAACGYRALPADHPRAFDAVLKEAAQLAAGGQADAALREVEDLLERQRAAVVGGGLGGGGGGGCGGSFSSSSSSFDATRDFLLPALVYAAALEVEAGPGGEHQDEKEQNEDDSDDAESEPSTPLARLLCRELQRLARRAPPDALALATPAALRALRQPDAALLSSPHQQEQPLARANRGATAALRALLAREGDLNRSPRARRAAAVRRQNELQLSAAAAASRSVPLPAADRAGTAAAAPIPERQWAMRNVARSLLQGARTRAQRAEALAMLREAAGLCEAHYGAGNPATLGALLDLRDALVQAAEAAAEDGEGGAQGDEQRRQAAAAAQAALNCVLGLARRYAAQGERRSARAVLSAAREDLVPDLGSGGSGEEEALGALEREVAAAVGGGGAAAAAPAAPTMAPAAARDLLRRLAREFAEDLGVHAAGRRTRTPLERFNRGDALPPLVQ